MSNSQLPLIFAGALATCVIAFGALLAGHPTPGTTATFVALLAVYSAGLGLGRLMFKRRG